MKTLLITGTSSGIGKETAILFAANGWNVAATVRKHEHLALYTDIENISTYVLDVKDKDSIISCIKQVIQDFGKIDVLVNNAGVYTTDPLEILPDEMIDNIIDTNLKGVIFTTKTVLEHFRKNRSGMIVNISSIAGRVTFPFQSIYHTSKWAIEGFSESLYYELHPLNIKVKIIEPGMVNTSLYNSILKIPFENYPSEYQTPFRKWHTYLMKNYKNGYSPKLDAKTIYRAVNNNSSKLRYTTGLTTKFTFFLRSLFPLPIFQSIIKRLSSI